MPDVSVTGLWLHLHKCITCLCHSFPVSSPQRQHIHTSLTFFTIPYSSSIVRLHVRCRCDTHIRPHDEGPPHSMPLSLGWLQPNALMTHRRLLSLASRIPLLFSPCSCTRHAECWHLAIAPHLYRAHNRAAVQIHYFGPSTMPDDASAA